jgi:hypothetical protein
MSFETHLDETLLREIYAYWQGKRGLRRMPARRDVDPVEMPLLLPHLLIGEVVDGGAQFRHRLTGTAIARALGYDPTGRTIDDIASGHYRDHINELHRIKQILAMVLFHFTAGRQAKTVLDRAAATAPAAC